MLNINCFKICSKLLSRLSNRHEAVACSVQPKLTFLFEGLSEQHIAFLKFGMQQNDNYCGGLFSFLSVQHSFFSSCISHPENKTP